MVIHFNPGLIVFLQDAAMRQRATVFTDASLLEKYILTRNKCKMRRNAYVVMMGEVRIALLGVRRGLLPGSRDGCPFLASWPPGYLQLPALYSP